MSQCAPLASPQDFLGNVIYSIDCLARTIGWQGYQALASSTSSVSIILSGCLSIFVALFGYRMLLGQTPSVRDGTLALVKIGLVLALATGWPAYRTLFYDVVMEGPAQLAGEIARPAGLTAEGAIEQRLQAADRAMVGLALAGTGEGLVSRAVLRAEGIAPPPFGGFDSLALGAARTAYLTSTIAAVGSVRLVAGLLLALGPLFIAFLLFDGTRGLFEGWLRGLVGTALGALGTGIVLAVELALLEPRLADWLARRAAGSPVPSAAAELLALCFIFSIALTAILYASARVARGLHLPPLQLMHAAIRDHVVRETAAAAAVESKMARHGGEESRRAVEVAAAVASAQRRERGGGAIPRNIGAPAGSSSARIIEDGQSVLQIQPIGRSHRRTRNRISASAVRRDRRA